jgi:hypothetical protein
MTVAQHVQRRDGRAAAAGGGGRLKRAGQADVVDVVAGPTGPGTVLTPAGHPAVDQGRVSRQDRLGPQAQPFHYPRAEPLDQDVGRRREVQDDAGSVRVLEVNRDRAPPSVEDEMTAGVGAPVADPFRAVDPDYLGAHVG